MQDWQLIALPGRKLQDRNGAILFQDFPDSKVWVEKKRILKTEVDAPGGYVTIMVARWVAEAKGLI